VSHALRVGVADQIGYFRAYNTDGSAKTDLVYNTAGLSLSVFRIGAAAVSISSLSAKAADNTAHADGAIRAVSGNLYTVDLPDAACADQVSSISVKGAYTGGVIEGPEHPLVGYNPATAAVGAVMPTVAGRTLDVDAAGAVELDSAVATQIDTIEAALTTLGSDSTTVERSVSDTNAITFSWPVSGATITGTASLNNGSYGAVAGAIAFLRTETGRHYYTLAYNVADRPAAEGQVRYKFVDGTYTGYVVLRTVNLVTAAQVNAQVLDVLSVDTFAELTAPPAATSSLKDKITWLFMYARNKVTQTAAQRKLYRDDGTTVAGTSGTTDDGTTFTKGEDA
jgi:hypothetical protein